MKNRFLFVQKLLFLLIVQSVLFSCCTMKKCINAFDQKQINLIGFNLQESEIIIVSSYIKGCNFNNLIDSASTTVVSFSGNVENQTIFIPIDLNCHSDYRIEFKNRGLSFQICDILTDLQKCNNCFLTEDYFPVLSGYKVNGQMFTKSDFEIVKEVQ